MLINGAGGNNPKCTTAHETYQPGDEDQEECKTFFNLDKEGFDFVFSLNLMGSLLPYPSIRQEDMLGEKDCCIVNISSMNAYRPLTEIPAYSAAKAAVFQHAMVGGAFRPIRHSRQCHRTRFLCHQSKQGVTI